MDREHEPGLEKAPASTDTADKSRTVGKYPDKGADSPPPSGPGTPEPGTMRAPTTTGTPGGALGAPTEAELKRDPEAESDRDDSRTDVDNN